MHIPAEIDCRWFRLTPFHNPVLHECGHEGSSRPINEALKYVTGQASPVTYETCGVVRSMRDKCGRTGKWWEARS